MNIQKLVYCWCCGVSCYDYLMPYQVRAGQKPKCAYCRFHCRHGGVGVAIHTPRPEEFIPSEGASSDRPAGDSLAGCDLDSASGEFSGSPCLAEFSPRTEHGEHKENAPAGQGQGTSDHEGD